MGQKMHKEYYNILDTLVKVGRKRSPYKPWPNPTVAVMCSYGWIKRSEPNGDWIVITDEGRVAYNTAEVSP